VKRLALCALVGLAAAACQSDRIASPTSPGAAVTDDALAASRGRGDAYRLPWGDEGLRVMQYNLYLGTNFTPIFQAQTDAELGLAIYLAYGELLQSNFPERAGKIAAQVAKVRPDLLGIEEVALWSVSADYTLGGLPTSPFVVQFDFLQLLLDSLTARGLAYTAPAVDTTSDVAVPVPVAFDATGNPTAYALVRFQDRDAVLVRAGVHYRDPQHGVFAAAVPLTLAGQDLAIKNGWSSVLVTKGGRTFRFGATHLNAEAAAVNAAQAKELVEVLKNVHDPVVWVGDFNSGPGVASDFDTAYVAFKRAGFRDLWPVAHPHDPGFTNGPLDGVGALDPTTGALIPYPTLTFTARVDLVWLRDRFGRADDVHAAIFGNQQADRTANGLWPSDHAAVGMVFELPDFFARHDEPRDRW
jgi:hypothetical protein